MAKMESNGHVKFSIQFILSSDVEKTVNGETRMRKRKEIMSYDDSPKSTSTSDQEEKCNKPASKRQRTQFTSHQLRRLEEMFQNVQYPDPIQRSEISTELGILELQVKNWFQNRRAKLKKDYWTARQRMDQACYPKAIAIPCGLPCLVNGPEGFHEQTECTYCQSLPVTAGPTALGNQWVQHRVTAGNTQYYDPGPYVSNYSNYCTFQRASQQDISTVIDANERVQVCNKDATEVKPTTINGKTRSYAQHTDSYRTNEKLRNLDQREINGQFRGQNFCRYQPGFCKLEPIVIE